MTTLARIVLATLIVGLAAGASPVEAGGYVGVGVSNHGISLSFGTSNWGIWGSSWNSGGFSGGFSATLSGYGEWVRVDGLGRVWRPWVAAGWQPYTHGRWVWTSMGWTWVAYEPWGWVPHHYGNWAFTTVGWVWSPGYAYHPGNVVWVSSGMHVGWYPYAPLGWSHYNRGYHHSWHDGYGSSHYRGYSRGYVDGWREARYATWVPRSRVTAENVSHFAVGHEVATHAVGRSRVTTTSASPTRAEVERYVGRPVPEARIAERKTTIDGREVRMVRPEGLERNVQRHGASTVERALAPEARPRTTGNDSRSTREAGADARSSARQTVTVSRRVETDRPIDTRRRSSTSSSAIRSRNPATASTSTKGSNRSYRSVSSTVPSSQARSPVTSPDTRRTVGKAHSTADIPQRVRTSAASASNQRSASRAAPVKTEPTTTRLRSNKKEPDATTSTAAKRTTSRGKTEQPNKTKQRRSRSRD